MAIKEQDARAPDAGMARKVAGLNGRRRVPPGK
jgi:hypothetical protein